MSALTRWEPMTTRWNPFKELPEVKKEDVKLTVQDDVMSIPASGNMKKRKKGRSTTVSSGLTGAL